MTIFLKAIEVYQLLHQDEQDSIPFYPTIHLLPSIILIALLEVKPLLSQIFELQNMYVKICLLAMQQLVYFLSFCNF
jgi:hypothetical protein